jgi:hypothetical protein
MMKQCRHILTTFYLKLDGDKYPTEMVRCMTCGSIYTLNETLTKKHKEIAKWKPR